MLEVTVVEREAAFYKLDKLSQAGRICHEWATINIDCAKSEREVIDNVNNRYVEVFPIVET